MKKTGLITRNSTLSDYSSIVRNVGKVLLNNSQINALHSFLDVATNTSSMLISEAYLHGVVEGIALRNKVVSE